MMKYMILGLEGRGDARTGLGSVKLSRQSCSGCTVIYQLKEFHFDRALHRWGDHSFLNNQRPSGTRILLDSSGRRHFVLFLVNPFWLAGVRFLCLLHVLSIKRLTRGDCKGRQVTGRSFGGGLREGKKKRSQNLSSKKLLDST